jgi:hypothetical protein
MQSVSFLLERVSVEKQTTKFFILLAKTFTEFYSSTLLSILISLFSSWSKTISVLPVVKGSGLTAVLTKKVLVTFSSSPQKDFFVAPSKASH